MARKILDELGAQGAQGTWNMVEDTDERHPAWAVERDIYGFDSRDTWSLDSTMMELLYERLVMFKKRSYDMVDLSSSLVKIDGEVRSVDNVLDELIELSRTVIVNQNSSDPMNEAEVHAVAKRVWSIWTQAFQSFWW